MWIFGYGSIIWKPSFPYVEHRKAWVRGWERRFWQKSPDHRGTPEAPGLVVTLVPGGEALCGGIAYRVDDGKAERILRELDEREQAGFERMSLRMLDEREADMGDGITYVARAGNPHWAGELSVATIVARVKTSAGPSGTNLDYVLRLYDALRALGLEDAHLGAILGRLREVP